VPAIGPYVVWRYDRSLSVIGVEAMRNGVNLSYFLSYVRHICNCKGYGCFPVLDDASLVAAASGRIRELTVRVATPKNLETVAVDERHVKSGMIELLGSEISTQVEIKFSVAARSPDIQPGKFSHIVQWFRGEKAADRGSISKLQARVIDDGGRSNVLDLLDSQLGMQCELDLPDDDPDRCTAIRMANVSHVFNECLPSLQGQFGK
jgi:hypothetical protein